MKYIKTFEEFNIYESAASAFSKFSNFISLDPKAKSNDPIDKIMIVNPENKRSIKLTSALQKDDNSPAKKLADKIHQEYKKDEEDESKNSVLDKDVSDEIAKRGEKYKKEYKEYDQEWTEADDRNLKKEVLIDFYIGAKDEETKKKIEKTYIDDPKLEPGDYKKAAINFSDEGVDAMYDKLGSKEIDDLLADAEGDGGDVAELVLRSKNATTEQRKSALRLQWVKDPSGPGAILMADHLATRLKMGKKANDGLSYRKTNGDPFSKRSYGGLRPNIEKENTKAVDKLYDETQEYYKKKGVKEVTVYRGAEEKDSGKYESPVESWTTDPKVAKAYGYNQYTKKIPVDRILMGHFDKSFPDPYAMGVEDEEGNALKSKEIVVLGSK